MKIAILGYYGFDNLGDEAVLAGILQTLSQTLGTNHTVTILSHAPEKTLAMHRPLHPGIEAISRWQRGAVASALTGTDVFILGGGSLLQDATSVKSVLWYTLMALLARKKSKKLLWWGQGIGPLTSPLSRSLVKVIARQANAITVRDEKSQQLLKEIGVTGSNKLPLEVVADPAFGLSVLPQEISRRQGVLFAPREWGRDQLGQVLALADGLPEMSDKSSRMQVTGLPMHLPHDQEYLERLGFSNALGNLYGWEGHSIAEVLEHVALSQMMVSVRLHSLIFAARVGVPFVALSYDPKVTALAAQSGQSDALLMLDTDEVTTLKNKLGETITRVRDTQIERSQFLLDFSYRQALLAARPGEIIKDW